MQAGRGLTRQSRVVLVYGLPHHEKGKTGTHDGRAKQTLVLVGKRVHQTTRTPVEPQGDEDAVHEKQANIQEEEGQPDAIEPLRLVRYYSKGQSPPSLIFHR